MAGRIRRLRRRSLKGLRRNRLDHLQSALANVGTPNGLYTEETITVTTTNEQVTATGTTFATGTQVIFTTTNTLPAGIVGGLDYFLRDAGTDVYTLHPSKADAVGDTNTVDITDTGTGTHTMHVLVEA